MTINIKSLLVSFVLIMGCVSQQERTVPSQTAERRERSDQAARDAEEAARRAIEEMESGGTRTRTSVPGSQPERDAGSAAQATLNTATTVPPWVLSPRSVYPETTFVSAVGSGPSRSVAEKDALFKVAGVFGQSVQGETSVISWYSEAVQDGLVKINKAEQIRDSLKVSVAMDSLIGAEVVEVWYDSTQRVFYALAVMEKAKTADLYASLITSNVQTIDSLTKGAEKNSLEGYARYQLAATVADANAVFATVLTVIGAPRTAPSLLNLKKAVDYRLEAFAIANTIPITVTVYGDRSNRIQSAFESALNTQGFKSGRSNNRYTLAVNVNIAEVPLQPGVFYARMELHAQLIDNASNTVLIPYSFTTREGHATLAEAENRTVRFAEQKITEEFGSLIQSTLLTILN
ncbi:MAG: LPP20 family lipoprotein [Treponema sp.]|jgi:hypothetical protein|nr:LPP20 family lipoprotein [Treponema sp.]